MDYLAVAIHIFTAVLVIGTLWRLVSFHAMASPNEHVNHLGKAMSLQY